MVERKKITLNQTGQSLLEMLIAIFILVVAFTATVVLVVTSINAGRDSINRMAAANLAREGIEIVRNIRDSNWVDPDKATLWDEGLVDTSGSNYSTALPIIDGVNSISLVFGNYSFATTNETRLKVVDNVFLQGLSITDANSNFYRLLYLNFICQNDLGVEEIIDKGSTAVCSSGYSKVGIRVIAEVRWPSADSGKKIIIEDRLYDWQVF